MQCACSSLVGDHAIALRNQMDVVLLWRVPGKILEANAKMFFFVPELQHLGETEEHPVTLCTPVTLKHSCYPVHRSRRSKYGVRAGCARGGGAECPRFLLLFSRVLRSSSGAAAVCGLNWSRTATPLVWGEVPFKRFYSNQILAFD